MIVFPRVAELCDYDEGSYVEFLFDGESVEQELVVQVFIPSYVSVFGTVDCYGPPVPEYGAQHHRVTWNPEMDCLLVGVQVYAPGKHGSWGDTSAEKVDVLENGGVEVHVLYDII